MSAPERPCTHVRARHAHGDRKRYVDDGCRCVPCTAANTAYARLCYRNQVLGITARRWVDAAPVAEHVRRLQAAGMGTRQIAAAAGVTRYQLASLTTGRAGGRGPQHRIHHTAAARILAVHLAVAAGARMPSRGVRRRVEALNALGWSTPKLASLIGMEQTNLARAVRGDAVLVGTHRAIAELYDQLWDQRPTPVTTAQIIGVNRTVNTARHRGYLPPLAWDDIDTDPEPPRAETTDSVVVDPIAVDRLVAGLRPAQVTRAELTAAVLQLHDRGLNDTDIGARVGMRRDAVAKLRNRQHARELARLIHLGVQLDAAATLTERRTA